jgi:sodium transport system permease protein
MKNKTFVIMKKECKRLFSDKKLLFFGIIFQGLLIFFMYTLLGNMMGSMVQVDDDYKYKVATVNMPLSLSPLLNATGIPFEISEIGEAEIPAVKEQISKQEMDALVEFPANFDEAVSAYDLATATTPAPQIEIWSNGGTMTSLNADATLKNMLEGYERSLVKKFDINGDPNVNYDLNKGSDFGMVLIMSMMPMLIIMLIFQGCMVIAPESIAGEKERGTLGTMLATPARRTDMALAKVVSITLFGFLGALATFTGLMLSLPRMVQAEGMTIEGYTVREYFLILLITISTVLVFTALLSVLSASAKSVKEANSYATPFLMLSVVLGISGMFTGGAVEGFYYYLIPIFNSAQSLNAIFNLKINAVNIAVTSLSNVAFSLLLVGVLALMFGNEKIVFDK